jgi:sulfur-carrier protein
MIKILLFARLREMVGASITYDCLQCTVQELVNYVEQQHPGISLTETMVAINEEFASNLDTVKSGDVVAFLPPVSGG